MVNSKNVRNFAIANEAKDSPQTNAQVAELVDALVSKTNEVTLVPVRSRPRVLREKRKLFSFFIPFYIVVVFFLIILLSVFNILVWTLW